MQIKVKIEFEVETDDYQGCDGTPNGAMDLVIDMLRQNADYPESVVITCDGETRPAIRREVFI